MRYTARALSYKDEPITVEVDVRTDAKLRTLATKCLRSLMEKMNLVTVNWQIEMPNIWLNGGVGLILFQTLEGGSYIVQIYRNDNGILIFG